MAAKKSGRNVTLNKSKAKKVAKKQHLVAKKKAKATKQKKLTDPETENASTIPVPNRTMNGRNERNQIDADEEDSFWGDDDDFDQDDEDWDDEE